MIFNENNLEAIQNSLEKEVTVVVEKDLFISEITRLEGEELCFDIRTEYDGEFFSFSQDVVGIDNVINEIKMLSTDGKAFEKFVLKIKIKNEILNDKHKVFLRRGEDENQKFIRIYKRENGSGDKFKFSSLVKEINSNFSGESFYVEDMGKFIVVSSNILNCNSLKELFPNEISFIEDVLNRHICPYCETTIINERFLEYLEFGGNVGKENICPECLSIYYSGFFSILNILSRKNISNMEKIEAVDYILKHIDK